MANPNQKCTELDTPKGQLTICSFCDEKQIGALSLTQTFKEYPRYHPIVSKIESLVKASRKPDANVTLAYNADNAIIGFGILKYPGPKERWVRVGDKVMMEVSVIEVGRQWRSMGISSRILAKIMDHPLKEDKIFFMVGYSWTWDVEGAKLSVMTYREMMIKLFSKFGFSTYQTNEPNIMLRPENLFMARIGDNISKEIRKKFKMVLYNMDL